MSAPLPEPLIIQIKDSPSKRMEAVLEVLQEQQCQIQTIPIHSHLFNIPPNGGALLITSADFHKTDSKGHLTDIIISNFQENPQVVIILEGYLRWGSSNRSILNQIFQSLLFLSPFQALPFFLPSRNAQDSAEIIIRIAKREQVEDIPPVLSRVNANTVYLSDAQEYLIMGLLNCGKEKAKKLLTVFDTPLKIFTAILESPEDITKISGFGQKFIEENQILLRELL